MNRQNQNNGVGYGGGDLLFGALSEAASTLAQRLAVIDLSRPKLCRASGLTVHQQVFCESFLHANAAALKAIAERAPAELFEITDESLFVNESGSKVEVVALTELGATGKIRVSRKLADKLSTDAIVALIGHELGHKIAYGASNLSDSQDVGPFSGAAGGRSLLDAAGKALAEFTGKLGSLAPVYDSGEVSTSTSSAGATFTNTVPVVVAVSATLTATHQSTVAGVAGINGVLTIDGTHCGHDQIMQSAAFGITLIANVSCYRLLQPGTHQMEARDATAGDYPNMSGFTVTLKYRAVAAPGATAVTPILDFTNASSASPSVTRTFTTTTPVVLEAAGRMNANFAPRGGSVYVAMSARIEVDGEACSESLTAGYFGAAGLLSGTTCLRRLEPGTHTISVKDAYAGTYAGLSDYGASVEFILSAIASEAKAGMRVEEITPDGSGGTVFTNTVPVVLNVTGYLTARHSDSVNGAGIFPVLYIDGNICGADSSFEFQAGEMNFHAAASCFAKLAPGSHVITVRNRGGDYAGMSQFQSRLQFSAMAQP